MFCTDPIVKQGTVLGPCLCSSSTGQYCGKNSGVCVGSTVISSLLYVDDVIDLSCLLKDYLSAHQNALLFKKMKKLTHSGTKCFSMILNGLSFDGLNFSTMNFLTLFEWFQLLCSRCKTQSHTFLFI